MTHQEESVASHKSLIAAYGNTWPMRKRWRVEGSAGGNSRMLMKHTANRAANRYGGRVVEVIPFTPIQERQAANMPACPRCKAKAGKPCKTAKKTIAKPHLVRWEALHEGT